MSTPEIIYLIPGEDIEGYPEMVWCESSAIYVNESSHLTVVGFFAFWHIKNKSNINQKPLTPYRGIRTLAPHWTVAAKCGITECCAIVDGLDRTRKA